jgi:hypothetical protein
MELLKTLNIANPSTGGNQVLDNWQQNKSADALVLDCAFPVTVGTGGTPTVADLVNLVTYFLGTVNLRYGPSQQYAAFEGITGADLRDLSRVLTQRELWNDFVGVAQTTGAKTWNARIYLPTFLERSQTNIRRKRRIGSAQGRTVKWEITEGAALTAGALNLTRTALANATYNMRVQYRLGGAKQTWCPIPAFRKLDLPQRDITGPDGLMLAVMDANAAAASTAIQKGSVFIGGNEVVRQAEPRYASAAYSRQLDAGSADVTDTYTMLYAVDPCSDFDAAQPGAARVALVNQDVTTLKLRYVFLPDIGAGDELMTGIRTVAASLGTPVNATLPKNDGAENGQQAVSPVEFYDPTDARYHDTSGIIATPGGQLSLYVAEADKRAAAGFVAAAPAASKDMVSKHVRKAVKLKVPGALDTSGNGRGSDLGSEGINRVFASVA